MDPYQHCVIRSSKHDGSIHRIWQHNWLIPAPLLIPQHAALGFKVTINFETPIVEASGKVWMSQVPAVSFFLPGQWYNVVALLEEGGIRYYCNLASPFAWDSELLTYIDYDLDVIRLPDGSREVVDEDEFELHKAKYDYPRDVQEHVLQGLDELLLRMDEQAVPFDDEVIIAYYETWRTSL
ncbi:DUF402 domain-containing protein [Paenibacillus sp. Leaf72]|uniref:DUF402 domain-containing protein n=1 Tax=Paenibacillus sp. Leaf72 TaxID=1736234 RepID=UPI0007004836|nr:DUF402 domain-containing protein [Paenibacillus sp. Leaf72]KQO18870.1 hypothetical protein ASF12_06035 [Paenibacillus sp. Leaf72]